MRKFLALVVAALLILGCAVVLLLVKHERAQEGYNSWAAVWNYLIRDGEIRIEFTPGWTIQDVQTDGCSDSYTFADNVAIAKVGYAWCMTTVTAVNAAGIQRDFAFNTQKLNDWSRIVYIQDEAYGFRKFENGVLQSHDDFQKDRPDAALEEPEPSL